VGAVTGLPDAVVARAVAVPLRREVLDLILKADHPVTVGELTDKLGCNHNAVRQHLAKLREAGLVAETREDRDRPGRPRLLYTATTPPNPYARLAQLLLVARQTGDTPRAVARRAGRAQAAATHFEHADALDALEADATRQGFSPRRVGRGRQVDLVLDTCPLADVAADDPATVCALHRGLAEGLVEGVGGANVETFAARDPYRAGCRVGVRRST
jgi:predicted ArsR family transcriptional regulator